jgi:hypothetical protein
MLLEMRRKCGNLRLASGVKAVKNLAKAQVVFQAIHFNVSWAPMKSDEDRRLSCQGSAPLQDTVVKYPNTAMGHAETSAATDAPRVDRHPKLKRTARCPNVRAAISARRWTSTKTPSWVTLALVSHLPEINGVIWEPASGRGKMVAALRQAGFDVMGSGITEGVDFLRHAPPQTGIRAIITNPPYALAREFIEHALHLGVVRVVAMLLRTDFGHAATRAHLFAGCPMLAKKSRADQAHPMV